MARNDFVKVEFVGEWMGNKPPTKMTLFKQKALDLEKRGILVILDSEIENKEISEAPKNKMIESPQVKKGYNKKK